MEVIRKAPAPSEPHLTNGMNDEELISYCEIHCTTERALFNAEQYNRMVELAGNPPEFQKIGPKAQQQWGSLHEPMERLCRLARARLRNAPDGSVLPTAESDPIGLGSAAEDEWIDPEVMAREADEARFREACAQRGLEASADLYSLWQQACSMTNAAHDAKTVDDRTHDELREELKIAAVFRVPVRLSAASAEIILANMLPQQGGTAKEDSFEVWWHDQFCKNGNVHIGADYRHWAKKGYFAAPFSVLSHQLAGGTIDNGLSDDDFTKVSYRGFTYSFPAVMPLSQVFVDLAELTRPHNPDELETGAS